MLEQVSYWTIISKRKIYHIELDEHYDGFVFYKTRDTNVDSYVDIAETLEEAYTYVMENYKQVVLDKAQEINYDKETNTVVVFWKFSDGSVGRATLDSLLAFVVELRLMKVLTSKYDVATYRNVDALSGNRLWRTKEEAEKSLMDKELYPENAFVYEMKVDA